MIVVVRSSRDYQKYKFIINFISSQKKQTKNSKSGVIIANQESVDGLADVSRCGLSFEKQQFSNSLLENDLIQQKTPDTDWSKIKVSYTEESLQGIEEKENYNDVFRKHIEAKLKEEFTELKEINAKQTSLLDKLLDENKNLQGFSFEQEKILSCDVNGNEVKISMLYEKITAIKSAYEALKAKNIQIQTNYSVLESQSNMSIQAMNDELSIKQAYIEALEKNSSTLNEDIKSLKEQLSQGQTKDEGAVKKEKEILVLTETIESMNKELAEKSALKRLLDQKEEEIAALNSQVKSLDEKLSVARAVKLALDLKTKELSLVNQRVQTLSVQLKEKSHLEDNLDEKEKVINNLRQQTEKLLKELYQVSIDKGKYLFHLKDLASQQEMIDSLNFQIKGKDDLQELIVKKENDLKDLSQYVNHLEETTRSAKFEKSILLKKTSQLEELSLKLKAKTDALEIQVREKEIENGGLAEAMNKLRSKLSNLQADKMQSNQLVSDKEIKISRMVVEIEDLHREKSQTAKLNEKVREQDRLNIKLSHELARVKNDLERLLDVRGQEERCFAVKRAEFTKLTKKMEDERKISEDQLRKKDEQNSDLISELSKLRNSFLGQLKEKYKLEESLAEKEVDFCGSIKQLEEAKKDLETNRIDRDIIAHQIMEIRRLKSELTAMSLNLKKEENREKERDDFKNEIKKLLSEIESLKKQKQELQNMAELVETNFEDATLVKKERADLQTNIYSLWNRAANEQSAKKAINQKDQVIANLRKDLAWLQSFKIGTKKSLNRKNTGSEEDPAMLSLQKLKMDLEIVRAENEHLKDRLLGD